MSNIGTLGVGDTKQACWALFLAPAWTPREGPMCGLWCPSSISHSFCGTGAVGMSSHWKFGG